MSEKLILKNKTAEGELLQATFLPEKGMNLISYKKGNIEIIDQSTSQAFEETFSGLGPLIGPHFYQRNPAILPKLENELENESLFPHIAKMKSKKNHDPFTHGISRYAPWQAKATATTIKGTLSGKDEWQGIPLSALEGQNFQMDFAAELTPEGLILDLAVVSDTDSIVGIHYYYSLPGGEGKVISDVQNTYYDPHELKEIPSDWDYDAQHTLTFDLAQAVDYAFHPFLNPLSGNILLKTRDYTLNTTYSCPSQENAWQLYHPQGASFVCVEPVSSQNPRKPNLSVSSINICLQIL